MKRSIQKKIVLLFAGLMSILVLSIFLMNNFLLERYYTAQQITQLQEAYDNINQVAMEQMLDGESISELLARESEEEYEAMEESRAIDNKNPSTAEPNEESENETIFFEEEITLLETIRGYGETSNIGVLLIDSATGQPLVSTVRDSYWLSQKVQRYILGVGEEETKLLVSHENYRIEQNFDMKTRASYLEAWGFLSDNTTLFFMSMPIASIDASVGLSNQFTGIVALVAFVLGSGLVYFVSRHISKPILDLACLSEKMSRLDFTARYDGNELNEIAILGNSMNTLSDRLEATIDELQTANQQLQLDLEEKIKIDEIRKDFIGNVSHELKTPIALIQGYAEGLSEGMCEDEESRAYYCEVIMDEASKMNKMVKQLLNLTALEFGNDIMSKDTFDITELISDYLNSASILLEDKPIELIWEPSESLFVEGDEFKTEEVIMNYLTNALDHVTADGVIRISVSKSNDQVKVSVFNTGSLIPEEELSKLWTKFYKVDKARTREFGGSGIGLSIVKAIVDAHGQSCGVENQEDGVSFWFTLKLV